MAVEFLGRELTVQRVLDAYAATGLKPINRAWSDVADDGTRCGCALSAVCIAEGRFTFEAIENDGDAWYELDNLRPPGFTRGFDGDPVENNEAYELGRQCREAVGL